MEQNTLETIKAAISRFSFTASMNNDQIIIRDKKGRVAATVTNGVLEQKFSGQQNLCGSVARDAIKAAMRTV